MSSFDKMVSKMDAVLFDTFGSKVILRGQFAVDAVIDRGVERTNQYGEVTVNAVELSFNKTHGFTIARGDTVQTDADEYKVKEIISDDGRVVVVSAS
jgi:hypothetical protein